MATIGGADFTNFRNVRVRGTVGNAGATPGALRLVATSALESTLSVNTTYQDSSYQWTLPAKSGVIGVSGTLAVHVGALAANAIASTAVVISGIRAEDGFVCNGISGFYETSVTTNRGVLTLISGRPTATGAELIFFNASAATATVYSPVVIGYTYWR